MMDLDEIISLCDFYIDESEDTAPMLLIKGLAQWVKNYVEDDGK